MESLDVAAEVTADEIAADAARDELPADRFLDRELSWLAFNNRVLDLAEDSSGCRCWSGPGSWRSSPPTSTSSSWSGSPA